MELFNAAACDTGSVWTYERLAWTQAALRGHMQGQPTQQGSVLLGNTGGQGTDLTN